MKRKLVLSVILATIFILPGYFMSFASRYTILVDDFSFSPSSISTVKVGDTITWSWVGGSHTTTSMTIPSGAASWDHPLNATSTSFSYIPTLLGTYNYKCTPHFSMGMIGSFVVSPLGTPDLPPLVDILIYPNPFVDNLRIRVESGETFMKDLKIYNQVGQMISEMSFDPVPGSFEKTFNLGSFPRGVIFLHFTDNDNRVYLRKILKL
jgi:hypothetical protein